MISDLEPFAGTDRFTPEQALRQIKMTCDIIIATWKAMGQPCDPTFQSIRDMAERGLDE